MPNGDWETGENTEPPVYVPTGTPSYNTPPQSNVPRTGQDDLTTVYIQLIMSVIGIIAVSITLHRKRKYGGK